MITDIIQQAATLANELSGGNQFIGGVLIASLSGSLMYLLKETPKNLLKFLRSQFTTTIQFNNAGWEKSKTFIRLSEYIQGRCTETGSRSLMVDSTYDWETGLSKMIITIGAGTHFFFYRGRPLMLTRIEHGNNQGETIKEIITLTKLGRSHKLFHDLIDDNRPKESSKLSVSCWEKGEWQKMSNVDCGGLDSIALDDDVKNFFVTEFNKFRNGADTCRRLGIPHKLSIILHGRPGSGKTSIIRALSSEYDFNVCTLDLSCVSDRELMKAIGTIPRNTLLLLEDFDSAGQVTRREASKRLEDGSMDITQSSSIFNVGTLSGMLNALDGIASLENVVVLLTTNHLNSIDPALCRPGRIDHIVELPPPSVDATRKHFEHLYPDIIDHHVNWAELPGCIIHRIKQSAMDNTVEAVRLLNYYADNPDQAISEQLGEIEHMERIRELRRAMIELELQAESKPDNKDTPVVEIAVNTK